MKDSYILHTSVSGFSILFLSVIFDNNNYGAVDYIILYKNNVSLMYLTERGYKEARELGNNLMKNDFYDKIISDSKNLNKSLESYKVQKPSKDNIIKEWEKYLKFLNDFCCLYRFYEQPFQRALEETILKHIPENKLIGILSNPSKSSIEEINNVNAKKVLTKLIELGKMKLKIHNNTENLVTKDFEKFINFVSKRDGINKNIVKAFTVKEFTDTLKGKTCNITLIKKRLDGCAIVKRNNKWFFETGDKYLSWEKKIKDTQEKEIKGKVAFSGKVQGRVVIHQSWTDTTKLVKGDILVTGMTNPQMIPFIKDATAIVTDEGGITCHAAIISREMKKPCITGTKNATQILKNGDLIEVDANKGIVKILKRAS